MYLLLWRDAERSQLILEILQLAIELLFFSVEILEDFIDVASVTTGSCLPAAVLVEQAETLLVTVGLRIERLVVAGPASTDASLFLEVSLHGSIAWSSISSSQNFVVFIPSR